MVVQNAIYSQQKLYHAYGITPKGFCNIQTVPKYTFSFVIKLLNKPLY